MSSKNLSQFIERGELLTFAFFALLLLIIALKAKNEVLTSIKIFLIILMLSFVPSVVSRLVKTNIVFTRISVETCLFTSIVCGGTVLLNGSTISAKNILFTFGIFVTLVGGSHLIDYNKEVTFDKIKRYLGVAKGGEEVYKIKTNFNKESKCYYIVTIFALTINSIGFILSWTKQFTLLALVISSLLISSFIVLFFLLSSYLLMSSSLYDEVLFLGDNSQKLITHNKEKKLEDAILVTHLRKVLLYDSIHNFILLFAFITVILSLLDVNINIKVFLESTLVLSFISIQLPYTLGQKALHNKILEDYEGLKRADLNEDLKKYAPLYPKFEFIAALIAPCTIGYFLIVLLEELLTSLIK